MLWTFCCFVVPQFANLARSRANALQFLLHTLHITGMYLLELGFQLNVRFRLAGPLRLADLFLLHLVRIEGRLAHLRVPQHLIDGNPGGIQSHHRRSPAHLLRQSAKVLAM